MRIAAAAAFATLAAGPLLHASSLCHVPSPRELTGGASLIVIGTATSDRSWRIERVVYGTATVGAELRMDDDAYVGACGVVEAGVTSLVCERRASEHFFFVRELWEAGKDLDYLSRRHFVERAEVLRALEEWIEGATPTPRFVRWIASADTHDTERDQSVTVHVIENLEWFAERVEKLERLDRELAARVLRGPVPRLLDDLRGLPPIENEIEFDCLVEKPEGALTWRELYDGLNLMLGAMWDSPEATAMSEALFQAEN